MQAWAVGKAPTAARASAAGQVQPALERFAQHLPFRVHATDDFRRGTYRERREVACSMAEIAPDPPGWLTALRFDIDTEGGGAAWIEAELPAPNLVIINPSTGHAHLVYMLGAWVQTDFGDATRLKVIRYAAAIERAYTAALCADTGYAGRFQHNPLSDAYITKTGRDAPYSLDELARYVDLTAPPQKKSRLAGIGRNVEIFDRLRRWAYAAVADWRMATRYSSGVYDGWCEAVADRANHIAADVGVESPRGPLKDNEVGHIAKSVARWVWEQYGTNVPPLLREARIAAQRERERIRQAARETARERSEMTRAEYVAPARRRRAEAQEMRANGISVREIARDLVISVREVYRLLASAMHTQSISSSAIPVVQGSPAPSDFEGLLDSVESEKKQESVLEPNFETAHGGAIARAIVSEYAVPARSAERRDPFSDSDRREVRGKTNFAEGSLAYIQRRIREIVAKNAKAKIPP